MPITSFLFGNIPQAVTIAETLVLDAATRVTTQRGASVTKWPVEDSNKVSDHVILSNLTLQIDALISEAPLSTIASVIGGLAVGAIGNQVGGGIVQAGAGAAISAIGGGAQSNLFGKTACGQEGLVKDRSFSDTDYPKKAYEYLLCVQKKGEPFSLVTAFKKYDNMVITNISAPQTSKEGKSLRVTLQLEEIRIVNVQTVQLPESVIAAAASASAASKANTGKQAASEAGGETSSNSTVLHKVFIGG